MEQSEGGGAEASVVRPPDEAAEGFGAGSASQATILFTDVEGSTEIRGRHGDRVADEILTVHEAIVRRQIEEHRGQEVAFLGDGFMAAFANAPGAVRSAAGIQRALAEHNRTHPDRQVRVRIGLHSGTVVERDGTLYGQAVHAAARVMAEAAGAQILISSVVKEQCAAEAEASFVDRGLFWLKGFPQRWRLFEVEWAPPGAAPIATAPGAARTPLVGREDERADLRRAVKAALGGQGSLVLVAGEAGVGKTRLVGESEREAEVRGMRVLVGHAVEMEGAAPYLPFVEILEESLVGPRSPEAFREALGDAAAEIARIVPALRRVLPDIPAPLDLPPEQARRYLWISMQEFVERASRDRPLLLVLEDLHWADESTILLLEYLAPSLAEMPVLVIGTFRDTEVDASHPLARLIERLSRSRAMTRISLSRLTREGVAAMVLGLAGAEAPEGLVRAIHAESEGNPFFVEEVFLHLAETGRVLDEQGRFRTDLRIDEIDVPQSVRLVLGRRLERLSEGTRTALGAAAVLGRVFVPHLVERVAGVGPDEVVDALDEAERARLVGPADAEGSRFAFGHELIRQTLLAETTTLRRQRLHARAAEAIEHEHGDDVADHAADLAYHLSRSGPGAEAGRLVRYLRMAGDHAVEASAFADAVAHFEHALPLAPESDREARAEVLERLAMALRSVGRWDDALRAMDRALSLYEDLGRVEAVGRLCWAMVYQLGWAARFEEAALLAGRGLGALGELPNPDRARLLAADGWIFGLAGDYDTATEMFGEALALAERLGDHRALADVLHLKTIHHMSYVQFDQGIEAGLRAAEVFEAEGALWDLASVLSFVLYQAGTMARVEQASELAERTAPLAERIGHLGATFLILADRVRSEGVMRGDLEAVERIAWQQVEVCEQGQLPWIYVGHMHVGLAAHWRGDWGEAEREIGRAVELEPPAAFAGQSAAILAVHLARDGRFEEALTLVQRGRDAMPVAGRVNSLGQWNMMLGFTEALYLAGRLDEAAAFAPLIEEARNLGVDWITFDCRLLRTRAAIAAAAGGRWDEADDHYQAALKEADALPHRIERADVRRLHARMLLDRDGNGDRERAGDLLEHAAREYREIGMPRYVSMVEDMLAEASGSGR